MLQIKKWNLNWVALLVAVLLITGMGASETKGPLKPTKKDKCPVCGMFVYKYPDWVAEIIFKDGSVDFFDGAKDMYKYYLNLKKYNPQKTVRDIEAIYATEWYDMKLIDASRAFFVIGSDAYGPMGHELIPLATKKDAETFMSDHKGKGILTFKEITKKVIDKLD